MPKHLIVDGFNVMRRDQELSQIERNNFAGAQLVLVERLAQYRRGLPRDYSGLRWGTGI